MTSSHGGLAITIVGEILDKLLDKAETPLDL